MKKKNFMRLVSGMLATSMAFTLVPAGAFAASPEVPETAVQSEIGLFSAGNDLLNYNTLGNNAADILAGTYGRAAQGDGWSYTPGENGAVGTLMIPAGVVADFGDTYAVDCNITNQGRIEAGVFNGTVFNQGKIWCGEFHGTVVNEASGSIGAKGLPKEDLKFYGEVQQEKGQIYDGIFYGAVTGTQDGGEILGGTFEDRVSVHAAVSGGLFKKAVSVTGGNITGGFFEDDVDVDAGKILGGIFTGSVENKNGVSTKGIFVKKIAGSGAPEESAYRHVQITDPDCVVSDLLETKTYDDIFVLGDWDFTVEYKGNHTVEKWLLNGRNAGSGSSLKMDSVSSEPSVTLKPLFKLEFDPNGVPTTSGDKENLGWSYADGTLTFEKDFVFKEDTTVSCPVKNNGTIENGTFSGTVTNDGTLKGGTYNGEVTNNKDITSGTFNNTVKNNGNITDGTFNGGVTNKGEITGGEFAEPVENEGKIKNGEFNSDVTNKGELAGGEFNKNVTNQENGLISGGEYRDTVENNGQPITGGDFAKRPTGTTEEVNLCVLTVPEHCTINETEQEEAVAVKGSGKSFTVKYLGEDFADLKWTADGAELVDAKANPITLTLENTNVSLTLVADKPSDSGNTGTTEKPSDSGNTGTTDKPSDSGSTGTTEKPSDSGNTGTTEKPSDSGNTGTTEKPSDSGSTGTTEKPSDSGNTGTTDKPSDSGNTGTTDKPSDSGNTGTTDKPGDAVKPSGTQSTDGGDGGFMLGAMIAGGVIVGGVVTVGLAAYDYMLDYIKTTLPEGAVPQTRQQLAVALWQYAGRPEVTAEGIELGEVEKAMRWAVENELIPAEGEYEDSVTDFEVLKAVNKTKKLLEKMQEAD